MEDGGKDRSEVVGGGSMHDATCGTIVGGSRRFGVLGPKFGKIATTIKMNVNGTPTTTLTASTSFYVNRRSSVLVYVST